MSNMAAPCPRKRWRWRCAQGVNSDTARAAARPGHSIGAVRPARPCPAPVLPLRRGLRMRSCWLWLPGGWRSWVSWRPEGAGCATASSSVFLDQRWHRLMCPLTRPLKRGFLGQTGRKGWGSPLFQTGLTCHANAWANVTAELFVNVIRVQQTLRFNAHSAPSMPHTSRHPY